MATIEIKRNSWMPFAFSVTLSVGIIISFALHYNREKVYGFPPISFAAGSQPQSGIFCIFTFWAVFIGFISLLLQFVLLNITNHNNNRAIKVINVISLLFGMTSLVGLMLVAAYPLSPAPENANWDWYQVTIRPHKKGAVTLFLCINVYFLLQTALTIIDWKKQGVILCCVRVLIMIVTITDYIVMKSFPYPRCKDCPVRNITEHLCDYTPDQVYGDNVTSLQAGSIPNLTLTEIEYCKALVRSYAPGVLQILLVIFLIVYFLTFCKEFHKISLSMVIKYDND